MEQQRDGQTKHKELPTRRDFFDGPAFGILMVGVLLAVLAMTIIYLTVLGR